MDALERFLKFEMVELQIGYRQEDGKGRDDIRYTSSLVLTSRVHGRAVYEKASGEQGDLETIQKGQRLCSESHGRNRKDSIVYSNRKKNANATFFTSLTEFSQTSHTQFNLMLEMSKLNFRTCKQPFRIKNEPEEYFAHYMILCLFKQL